MKICILTLRLHCVPILEIMSGGENTFPKARRSASADAAFRADAKRVEKMTMEERMSTALSLGKRFSGIRTSAKGK